MDPLYWLTLVIIVALCLAWLVVAARRKPPAPPSPDTVRAQLLEKARHDLLDHKCKAEYHQSMTNMLRARVERLATGEAK